MGQVGEAKSWFRRAKKISEKRMQMTPGLSATCPLASTSWAMQSDGVFPAGEVDVANDTVDVTVDSLDSDGGLADLTLLQLHPLCGVFEASAFARRSREERARRGSRTRGVMGFTQMD